MNSVSVQFFNDRRRWEPIPHNNDQVRIKQAIGRSETMCITLEGDRTANTQMMSQVNTITGRERPLRLYLDDVDKTIAHIWTFENDIGSMMYSQFLTFQMNARMTLGCGHQHVRVFDDNGVAFNVDIVAMTQTNLSTSRVRRIGKVGVTPTPTTPIPIECDMDEHDDDDDVPDDLRCPITTLLFKDPVVACDGHTYERSAIMKWLSKKQTSPLHGAPMATNILTDVEMKRKVDEYRNAI